MQPQNWSLATAFLAGWGIAWNILYYLLLAVFLFYVSNQVRKPTRWVGLIFAWIMNLSHSKLTDWGLSHVRIENDFVVLDVGCGGGQTIQKLAVLAKEGAVYGVDYAKGSVAASRAKNAQLIRAGRVQIHHGSVSRLPFPGNKFNLITAVETQYYWPDLPNDLQEIRRVLKPGGTLLVIAETYKGGRFGSLKGAVMKLLRSTFLSVKEERELLAAAGYTNIEVFEERAKGWMCAIGNKPEDCNVAVDESSSAAEHT
jgi:ubiquinone/menaquinone biosynthesis C-methylase UbiE